MEPGRCEDLIETLEDLKPYTSMILELLDNEIEANEFFAWKYHEASEQRYYYEVIRLKKIRNLLAFVLR